MGARTHITNGALYVLYVPPTTERLTVRGMPTTRQLHCPSINLSVGTGMAGIPCSAREARLFCFQLHLLCTRVTDKNLHSIHSTHSHYFIHSRQQWSAVPTYRVHICCVRPHHSAFQWYCSFVASQTSQMLIRFV